MHPFALWLWGRLTDFERMSEDTDPATVLGAMTDTMRQQTIDLAPLVIDYLSRLGNHTHDNG